MGAARNYKKYKKLNRNGSEIRLLEVLPAANVEDGLKCRLVNTKPTDELDFIGLSALTGGAGQGEGDGDDDATQQQQCTTETLVLLGNHRHVKVAITAALGEALRHLRAVFCQHPDHHHHHHPSAAAWLPHHPWQAGMLMRDLLLDGQSSSSGGNGKLLVWAPELCINHDDAQELAGRREHMRLAYKKAKAVVGWLGPRDETSDTAVEIIRMIDAAMPANFGHPADKIQHPEHYAPRCEWLDALKWFWEVPAGTRDPTDTLVFRSISGFMARPYLQSDWILQDLAMATCPTFLIGDKIIPWTQMLRFLRNNEDLVENGATMFPDEFRELIQFLPLGAIYTLLKDFGDAQHSRDSLALGPKITSTRLINATASPSYPLSSSNSTTSFE